MYSGCSTLEYITHQKSGCKILGSFGIAATISSAFFFPRELCSIALCSAAQSHSQILTFEQCRYSQNTIPFMGHASHNPHVDLSTEYIYFRHTRKIYRFPDFQQEQPRSFTTLRIQFTLKMYFDPFVVFCGI